MQLFSVCAIFLLWLHSDIILSHCKQCLHCAKAYANVDLVTGEQHSFNMCGIMFCQVLIWQ